MNNTANFDSSLIISNLQRLQSQVFSLLPKREEQQEWIKPLETIIIELSGFSKVLSNCKDLLTVVCKLQGIYELKEELDFLTFRRSIFECCGLLSKIVAFVKGENE